MAWGEKNKAKIGSPIQGRFDISRGISCYEDAAWCAASSWVLMKLKIFAMEFV